MNAITIPKLYCPFPSAISPFAEAVDRHTDEWVATFDLCSTEAKQRSYEQCRGTLLASRSFPTASVERVEVMSDLFVLLFLVDDELDHQFERAELIREKENLEQFIAHLVAIMSGKLAVQPGGASPILAAFTELWGRIEQLSSPGLLLFLKNCIMETFRAAIWEFDNVHTVQLPNVAEFLENRQFVAAANVATDFIPFANIAFFSEELLGNPTVQRAISLCRNVICWANDLFSLSKELGHGDEHNLVCVLKHERKLSLEEAILQAAAIHDEQMHEFIALSQQLPPAFREYAQTLTYPVRANIEWSEQDTSRYCFAYQE